MSSKAEIASGSVNVTVDVLKATSKEAAVVVDALAPFLPLISEVGAIVAEIIDLYQTAEHNKRICGSLLSRVTTAENAVNILKIRRLENEDLFKSKQYYKDFQKLVNVIKKIQKFIADVSQLNGLRKFLLAHSIEDGFKRLTDEFDGLMRVLNFSLAIQTQIQVEDDNKALRKDIEEMTNARGIADKLSQINDKLDDISQLNILWQKQLLNSDEDELRSAKIPFTELHDPPQPVRRGKVIKKVRLGEDVAIKAKPVSKEDDKKDILGQVIILKKLKESQFICQFYGVSQDGDIMYLVTEWCEFGNLTDPTARPPLKDMFMTLNDIYHRYLPQTSPRPALISKLTDDELPIDDINQLEIDNEIPDNIISIHEAINEHKKQNGDKALAWNAFKQHSEDFDDILAK
ncbi:24568_t:CDS:2 [Entrophospora sp. SA101]|nr:24568_t:CDS:2 [Entrophospora sp. SA101]CAJ0918179.1 14455_t:CDS:2 [Entrophospora sp. SA101]